MFQNLWNKFDELYFRELTKGDFKMAPGSVVAFVDNKGNEHNALVIHEFKTSLNIAYIDPDPEKGDSHGNLIVRETSVPFFEAGMYGYYIRRLGVFVPPKDEEASEEENDIDGMGPLKKGVQETLE